MSTRKSICSGLLAALFLVMNSPSQAQLRLPDIFSDNMVLQQQTTVHFHGWGNPTEKIKVKADWITDTLSTVVESNAEWSVNLKTPEAGGSHQIKVMGDTTLVIHNILIGENWLCSGQSNMEMSADWQINNYKQEIANANHPEIRFFKVDKVSAPYPQQEVRGEWKVLSPQSMHSFSAAGYFFGRKLHEELHEPIGLIQSAWGGTPVEAWMPGEIFSQNTNLAVSAAKLTPVPWCPVRPSVTYNAMINPLINFPIAGAIWYQGEENTSNPETYQEAFSKMIESWRARWDEQFPFYFVQIAPFTYEAPKSAALVREAQLKTYKNVPKTGIVITTDIVGDTTNIHPKNKQDVGKRLAFWALANTYHQPNIVPSGPIYQSMEVQDNRAIIHFDFAEDGLQKKGIELRAFMIAGEDLHFVQANAKIDGNTVLVSSPKVDHPAAVRMGFSNAGVPNLFNKAGLPASPFRTDDWKIEE